MAQDPNGLGGLAGFKPLPVQQPNQPPQLRTPAQTSPGSQGAGALGAVANMNRKKPTIPGNPFVQQNKGLQNNLAPAQKLQVNQQQGETIATEEKIKLQELKNEELKLKREQAEFKLRQKQELFRQEQQNNGFESLASANL